VNIKLNFSESCGAKMMKVAPRWL